MMIQLIFLWSVLFLSSFENEKVSIVSLEQLQEKTINTDNDTLYVVNYWATWCKPCVHEMPYFEKANEKFSSQKVKIIFVSLNYARELQGVDRFVRQNKIQSTCYLLDAGNPNVWIDKIEPQWGGSIPATVMYRNGKKVFFREGEFTEAELNSIIKTKIQ